MRVVVVCFGFEPSNLRKQPWRYVHELIKGLPDSGIELTVVTDVDRTETAGFDVTSVEQILDFRGPSAEVVSHIDSTNPDVVVTLIGPTTFVRASTVATATEPPTIGIFAGPRYSLSEVLAVGPEELVRNRQHLAVHLLGSVVPDRLIRWHSTAFDRIVTLTHETGRRLRSAGVATDLSTVRPGIDEFDYERPDSDDVATVRSELNPADVPMILYFTSPLTLRGTDTLVEAFANVRATDECKLTILSRQDEGGLSKEEARLKRLAEEHSVEDSFKLVPRNLSPEGVKTYLAAADIVALPYKLVQASVPISILETMAVGTPLVSTRTGGIAELVNDDRQLVQPGDVSSLTRALKSFTSDPELREQVSTRNRKRMATYQRWDDARTEFRSILRKST